MIEIFGQIWYGTCGHTWNDRDHGHRCPECDGGNQLAPGPLPVVRNRSQTALTILNYDAPYAVTRQTFAEDIASEKGVRGDLVRVRRVGEAVPGETFKFRTELPEGKWRSLDTTRPCTCHPDDAPVPCQHKYAASECQSAAATMALRRGPETLVTDEMRRAGSVASGFAPDHVQAGPMAVAIYRAMHAVAPVPLVSEAEDRVVAAYRYLRTIFEHCAPQCTPLPDLMGICTQVDNVLAGARIDAEAANMVVSSLENRVKELKSYSGSMARAYDEHRAQLAAKDARIAELDSMLAQRPAPAPLPFLPGNEVRPPTACVRGSLHLVQHIETQAIGIWTWFPDCKPGGAWEWIDPAVDDHLNGYSGMEDFGTDPGDAWKEGWRYCRQITTATFVDLIPHADSKPNPFRALPSDLRRMGPVLPK